MLINLSSMYKKSPHKLCFKNPCRCMYIKINAWAISKTTHKNLGRNKGWLHWGRSRHPGHQGCKKRDLFIVYIFVFKVLCHLHILTIQNECLKTKSLHKILQRKNRKENVREGQKQKGTKEDLRRKGKRKAEKGKHLITALLLQNFPGMKSAFLSILPCKVWV